MIFFVETVKTWFSYGIILLTNCYGNVQLLIMQQYLFFKKVMIQLKCKDTMFNINENKMFTTSCLLSVPQHIGEN